MSLPATRNTQHEVTVYAPAETVYRLITDVTDWPQIFPPTVHVEYLERSDTDERLRIWATANGEAKTWTSRRELDAYALRVDFRQEVSQPPVGAMGGSWVVEPVGHEESVVKLLHDYRAVDDDPEKLAWIDQAVDRNSHAELAALKANAELRADSARQALTFDDTVRINGSSKDVYEFINQAQLWQERLPHVARVSLREETPGLQILEMDTQTKDGSVHNTKSVRVCFPYEKIVYKQIVLPALMTLHTGCWLLSENADGVVLTSRHTVAINEANIESVLGENADLSAARTFVRQALLRNSRTTMESAKAYAESRH